MRRSEPTPGAPPRRAPQNALATLLVLVTAVLLTTACGRDRSPGGEGRLGGGGAAGPRVLTLRGTPYQMGWWQGTLLRDAIVERASAARELEPADYIEAFADQVLHRLSERMRQELDGMAAGTGLEPLDLLRAEVAPEVLRFKGGDARLQGMAGIGPTPDGFEARMRYVGAGAEGFARAAVLVHRAPTDRPASLALARHGSLGAWAYVTATGRGYLIAEVDMTDRRRMGFGGGRPFELAAREALDAAEDVEQFTGELTGSMGHTGLGFSFHPGELPPLRAMGGVQVYTAPDLPWALGDRPFLAVGPYDDPESPPARALQAQVVASPALSTAERFVALAGLGPPPQGAPLVVSIRARDGHVELAHEVGGVRGAVRVALEPR